MRQEVQWPAAMVQLHNKWLKSVLRGLDMLISVSTKYVTKCLQLLLLPLVLGVLKKAAYSLVCFVSIISF